MIEGRYVDSIQLEGDPNISNFFNKFKDAVKPQKTQNYMSVPIVTASGHAQYVLLIVSKLKRNSQFS